MEAPQSSSLLRLEKQQMSQVLGVYTHTGDLDEASGSWIYPDPVLKVVAVLECDPADKRSLSAPLSLPSFL